MNDLVAIGPVRPGTLAWKQWLRFGSALLSLALALLLCAVAFANSGDDNLPPDSTSAAAAEAPGQMPAPKLVLQLTAPADLDVAVPLETDTLTVQGMTLSGAVVSIDGNLADVDAQGTFAGVAVLAEGANAIDVVASDDQGNQLSTTLYVIRGE